MFEKEGVIYTRVSTAKQVTEGSGLESQRAACLSYAKEHEIKVIKTFSDAGFSGATTKRPSLHQLINFLKSREKHTYIIFHDLSRVARDNIDYYALKSIFKSYGGTLLSTKEDLDDTAESELIEGMRVSMNTFYRRFYKELSLSNMEQRLHSGYWQWPAPVGLKYLEDSKVLVEEKRNSILIQKIYEDFAAGKYISFKQIKDSYEAKCLTNKKNKPFSLKDGFIKNILSNNLYRGVIHYPKWNVNYIEATHEGFISEDLFEAVQRKLIEKGVKRHVQIPSNHFPLKGNIECGTCNKLLVASYSKGRNQKYPYYRCNSKKRDCSNEPKNMPLKKIHEQFLDLLKGARINKSVLKLGDAILEDVFNARDTHLRGIEESNANKLAELKAHKKRQIKKIVHSTSDEVIQALEKDIQKIEDQISILERPATQPNELENFKLMGQQILIRPDKVWATGNIDTKKAIFNFVFEENIKVTGNNVGTAAYALPYRLMRDSNIKKVKLVELGGIEPPTSCVPRKRSPS